MDLEQGVSFFGAVHERRTVANVGLLLNIEQALLAYRTHHSTLPRKVIIYHGVVGDGNIGSVDDIEAKLKGIYDQMSWKLELLFINVNKRTHTRLFHGNTNSPPGTIVDDVITLPERLVHQSSKHSTECFCFDSLEIISFTYQK